MVSQCYMLLCPCVYGLQHDDKQLPMMLLFCNCTARQCSPLRRKFMECSIISPALSLLIKHLVIGRRQKLLISRLFIDHHTVVWFPLVSIS